MVVCCWSVSWRTFGIECAHRRKRHGRPAWQEHSITAAGSAATVHLQSLGRIRRSERCGAAVARCDVPVDRLREVLGSWGSVAFAPALVRHRVAEPGREPGGLGRINRELIAKAEATDSPQ